MSSDVRQESRLGLSRSEDGAQGHPSPHWWGMSCWRELHVTVSCPSLQSGRHAQKCQRHHSLSGRLMSFSVEERKSSKFTVGLPLILSWHQFPEMGAKSTLCGLPPHHGSARLGQRGGLSAATTVSPPREAAVEPHGDLSPGDVNRALNLSVPKRLTFGFCLVASLWGKFSEPIDSLFVFKPV